MSHARWGVASALALCMGMSCDPFAPNVQPSTLTVNACPDHPCGQYGQHQFGTLPLCNQGLCTVCETANCIDSPAYVLLVSLPTDSAFSPGLTYAISGDTLFSQSAPTSECAPPDCAHLPSSIPVRGYYSVTNQEQLDLGFYLDNPRTDTVLPAQATYRFLWPQSVPCGSQLESTQIGVAPVVSREAVFAGTGLPPGPADGGTVVFQAEMQPGCYELTLVPDSPFDEAFPPHVTDVLVTQPDPYGGYSLLPDFTTATSPNHAQMLPTFQVSRQLGLDGWRAFLRDATTLRPVSGARLLQGVTVPSIVLATSHVASSVDALTNTELVIEPPDGQPVPTEHIPLPGATIDPSFCYPPMPGPVAYNFTVTEDDQEGPVEADLLFQTTRIYVYASTDPCLVPVLADAGLDDAASDGASQPSFLNYANFEFSAEGHTSFDAGTEGWSLSVALPPGEYNVVVRPSDLAHSVVSQSIVVFPNLTDAATQQNSFLAPSTVTVSGSVYVADGRPLSQASVVGIPVSCEQSVTSTSDACLPKGQSTTTGADGSFSFQLDHGEYFLSIRPVEGTGLPWLVPSAPFQVSDAAVSLAPVYVPAPTHALLRFEDANNNPIVGATVRVLTAPDPASTTSGAAASFEIGHGITDEAGSVDLILPPPSP